MATKEDEKKANKEKVDEVITAVYKVNLHCQQCARDIKKPLLSTQGVQTVDVDIDKGEIKVKGVIDVIKVHKRIEKLSKKRVELVSPQVKIKESSVTVKKVVKETKEPILRTMSVKVHMHCDECENHLRKKLLKHQGIYSVKTDAKAGTITVHGIIEPDKLLAYLRKKVHKSAEIVTSKTDKKEPKKEEQKKEEKKKEEQTKEEKNEEEQKKEEKKKEEQTKEEKKKEEQKKDKPKDEAKLSESTEVIEFEAEKKVEVKTKEGSVPYFIHYVYAPQLFSDENPNACFVM